MNVHYLQTEVTIKSKWDLHVPTVLLLGTGWHDTFSGQISVATTYFHYLTAPVMATVSLNQSDC